MDLQLGNKTALVTGSTAGIGNAIATSLAREGAAVIVNGRSAKAVAAAVDEMKTAGATSGCRHSGEQSGHFRSARLRRHQR
jgi:3-oxoacyl-[acyl-carrier protein] reductase